MKIERKKETQYLRNFMVSENRSVYRFTTTISTFNLKKKVQKEIINTKNKGEYFIFNHHSF